MTNREIDALQARIQSGDLLTKEEQLYVLQQMHRANRRIQQARRAGFTAPPASAKKG